MKRVKDSGALAPSLCLFVTVACRSLQTGRRVEQSEGILRILEMRREITLVEVSMYKVECRIVQTGP